MAYTVQQYDVLREEAMSGKLYIWNRLVDENGATMDFQLKFHDQPTAQEVIDAVDAFVIEHNERLAAEAAAQQGE